MHDYWAIEKCSKSKRHWSKRMCQARRKKVLLEGGEGGKGKKEALSQTRTPGLLHVPGKKDLLLRSPSNATADVGRSLRGLGTSSFSTVTSLCQEVLRKVIISKHRELPKPPLQRGAGKGSEIPRKTQLRDSSYLVKSRIVGLFLCLFFFSFVYIIKSPWELQ